MTLKVNQGHWRWHNSISHISLSISGLLKPCVYFVSFLIYSTLNNGVTLKCGLEVTHLFLFFLFLVLHFNFLFVPFVMIRYRQWAVCNTVLSSDLVPAHPG